MAKFFQYSPNTIDPKDIFLKNEIKIKYSLSLASIPTAITRKRSDQFQNHFFGQIQERVPEKIVLRSDRLTE